MVEKLYYGAQAESRLEMVGCHDQRIPGRYVLRPSYYGI
jgi:hypothetical protein